MSNNRSQAFNWVFTLNNPTPEDESRLTDDLPYRYLIFQYECGENLTNHIQGYFVLDAKKTLAGLKKILPRFHLEIRRGSHEQAKAYSSKDDTRIDGPYEYGSEKGIAKTRGARSDLLLVKKAIDEGANEEQIWKDHFAASVRYWKSFERYRDVMSKHREYAEGEKPKIIILWGPSGTGKSFKAKQDYPGAYWLTKPSQKTTTLWWERYASEEVVVLDEFYGWVSYDLLLRLLDYYHVTVEKKGSSAKLAAKTWVFTSNQHPDDWYKKVADTHALKRRIAEFGTITYLGETFNT
ncbi:MAG: putative viral replication protein [Cressdnaviricota sp.]|nr:MAG: putative viral replication protein [Cressdnaviricota sp.]